MGSAPLTLLPLQRSSVLETMTGEGIWHHDVREQIIETPSDHLFVQYLLRTSYMHYSRCWVRNLGSNIIRFLRQEMLPPDRNTDKSREGLVAQGMGRRG